MLAADADGTRGAAMAIEHVLRVSGGSCEVHLLVDSAETGRTVRRHLPFLMRRLVSCTIVTTEATSTLMRPEHLPHAAAFRLFAPSILGDRHRRIVYLDTDALAMAPLDFLFQVPLGRSIVGAAIDTFVDIRVRDCHSLEAQRGIARSPLPRPARYFNSGVMVIDTGRWLSAGIARQTVALLQQHAFPFFDQDALNIALQGQWHEIPPRFNVQTSIEMAGSDFRRTSDPALRAGLSEARVAPVILHYCGSRKPWHGLPHDYPLEGMRAKLVGR